MSLEVRYDAENGVVETVLSGTITPAELREETVQAASLAEERGCRLILSDFSRATMEFSVTDVFNLPGLQDEQGLQRGSRVAVIAPKSEAGKMLADFYETVCVNRGWDARAFGGRQEAVDWLLD